MQYILAGHTLRAKTLFNIWSKISGVLAIIITFLFGALKYESGRRKNAEQEAAIAKRNRELTDKKAAMTEQIDLIRTEQEIRRANEHIEELAELGRITNEINEMSNDTLINNVNSLLNDRKARTSKGAN